MHKVQRNMKRTVSHYLASCMLGKKKQNQQKKLFLLRQQEHGSSIGWEREREVGGKKEAGSAVKRRVSPEFSFPDTGFYNFITLTKYNHVLN